MFLSLNLQYIHNLYYTVAPAEVRLVETRLVSFQLKNESLKKRTTSDLNLQSNGW